MPQLATKSVLMIDIMRSRAFGMGVADYRAGIGFRPDADLRCLPMAGGSGGIWAYERGRQFAACYSGPIRDGRKVSRAAYATFLSLWNNRSII